jgi:hypothetical protein
VQPNILIEDRVTYAEAQEITGRSHGYLAKRVRTGELRRIGGQPSDVYTTFLSRAQVEALALHEYRRGLQTEYWMTMTEVAELTCIARANVHRARGAGRLIAQRTTMGDWLVRRTDAYRFALIIDPSRRRSYAVPS